MPAPVISWRSAGLLVCAAISLVARQAVAQRGDTLSLRIGAFVDTYYAYDFGRPPTLDRSFAGGIPFGTQPARHNEFNVNLAFVDLVLAGEGVRGRLALQTGTSVQSNYAAEPTRGAISGPSLTRHIQEALVGVRLHTSLWLDAGIHLSHVGMEGWISRDNLTYTRSLVADYSPYYGSGLRLTWSPRAWFNGQVHLLNGWQNVSESNDGKGAGARIDLRPASWVTISGFNIFSRENVGLRALHGMGGRLAHGRFAGLFQIDLGFEEWAGFQGRTAHWWGYTLVARAAVTPRAALVARFERFDDDKQVVARVGGLEGVGNFPLRSYGESLGLDVALQPRALWRTEVRFFQNSGYLFPDGDSRRAVPNNALAVTSLALTF